MYFVRLKQSFPDLTEKTFYHDWDLVRVHNAAVFARITEEEWEKIAPTKQRFRPQLGEVSAKATSPWRG